MRTIREEAYGKVTLRMVLKDGHYVGIVISRGKVSKPIEDDDPDELWVRLKRSAGTYHAGYVGYDGARARFRRHFSAGFRDPRYRAMERAYKLKAAEKLRTTLPLEAALDANGAGEAALAVFRATNLVSPFEQTRLQAVLRGPNADEFIQAAAAFALGDIKQGLARMTRALRPDEVAKWPVVTYLPYLWRPEEHMFLKPEVTKDYADRVGHAFTHEYGSELTEATYRSLLDLAGETREQVADLEPEDSIDIQSFIWVVGKYADPEEAPEGPAPTAA